MTKSLSFSGIAAIVVASMLPFFADAAGNYSITGNISIAPGTTNVTLSGTASANSYTGQKSDQHIAVDWTGACSNTSKTEFSFTSITFVGGTGPNQNNGSFNNATWNTSHTYPAAGSYSACVKVYHAQFSGAEGSDAATFNANIVIPPTTGGLIVTKTVVNAGGGTAATSSFSFSLNGTATTTFNSNGINSFLGKSAGTYKVAEPANAHYTASYGGACDSNGNVTVTAGATSTCTITNTFNNNLPVATDSSVSTDEDVATVGATMVASDTDLDALLYSIVTNPVSGLLSGLNVNTGAFTYTPSVNFNGSDSLTFQVFDGYGNSNVATVSITVNPVNDNPDAVDDSVNVNEDSSDNVINVLGNDTDAPDTGETLFVSAVGSASNGTVVLDAGTVKYSPNAGYVGSDSFTYSIEDGNGGNDTATVNINVSNANDVPVAQNDSYSTPEDTMLDVTTGCVLGNDTDSDGNTLTSVMFAQATNGTVVLNSDGCFTYTPDADFNGTDSFQYQASDNIGPLSAPATVTITVNAGNDAPIATDSSIITSQNVQVAGALSATDTDGNALTYATTTNPANGTLIVFNVSTGAYTYLPNLNFNGSDSFTFKANDGTTDSNVATVSITVTQSFENTSSLCSDGIDNDNDGLTDLADPDCAQFVPACSDAADNDSDTLIDSADPGCHSDGNASNSSSFDPNDNDETHQTIPTRGSTECSDGVDNDGDLDVDMNDRGCTDPSDDSEQTNDGGGNSSGSMSSGGQVLGASTSTLPELPEGCDALLKTFMRQFRKANNAEEVKKLQQFLNDEMNAGLPVTGVFGPMTDKAVRNFQKAHTAQVLTPWGLNGPTGFVYLTTQRWINLVYCDSLNIPIPTLVPFKGE